MYWWQGVVSLVVAVVLPFLFGYGVMHSFEGLRGVQLWRRLRDRSVKIVFWTLVAFGVPVLVYYWLFKGHPDYSAASLLIPVIVACVAMMAGVNWRTFACRRERRKRPQGDWVQNRF